jgi:hypothetical protein
MRLSSRYLFDLVSIGIGGLALAFTVQDCGPISDTADWQEVKLEKDWGLCKLPDKVAELRYAHLGDCVLIAAALKKQGIDIPHPGDRVFFGLGRDNTVAGIRFIAHNQPCRAVVLRRTSRWPFRQSSFVSTKEQLPGCVEKSASPPTPAGPNVCVFDYSGSSDTTAVTALTERIQSDGEIVAPTEDHNDTGYPGRWPRVVSIFQTAGVTDSDLSRVVTLTRSALRACKVNVHRESEHAPKAMLRCAAQADPTSSGAIGIFIGTGCAVTPVRRAQRSK